MVLYDYLVHPAILDFAPATAERIFVGKRGHQESITQKRINALLIEQAAAGRFVVRLKGGDPFVFGRGGEEAEALAMSGIAFEVVPGVSSAIAVPAYAGIPLTHRGVSSSFTVLTGHEDLNKDATHIDWAATASIGGTLVILMSAHAVERLTVRLMEHGWPAHTPVAIIRWGTYPHQETISGTLESIGRMVADHPTEPPAMMVVGAVAALRERLGWFEQPE